MERTLIILKPDAVKRGIVGEILTRFERAGLKIIAAKMVEPDYDHYYHHYENISKMISRRGQQAFDDTLTEMQQGPVIVMILEGIEAVSLVRKMVGATEPKAALPGTIRGDYSHISFEYAAKESLGTPNVIHASGNLEEAEAEIKHWFSESEVHEYSAPNEFFTLPKRRKKK